MLISNGTLKHLDTYLRKFHKNLSLNDFPFYCKDALEVLHPMIPNSVEKYIKGYGAEVRRTCPEVPELVHPHIIMHFHAMHLYEGDMPFAEIGRLLGHSNSMTTVIYAKASVEMKRNAIEKTAEENHPLKAMKPSKDIPFEEEFLHRYGLD